MSIFIEGVITVDCSNAGTLIGATELDLPVVLPTQINVARFGGVPGTVGSVDINPNPTEHPIDHTGRLMGSYADIFFGYMKYTRGEYSFGVIPSDEEIEIIFWNARTEKQGAINIIDVLNPSDTSLQVITDQTAPFLLAALEETTYAIATGTDGDPRVEDQLIIVYDIEDDKIFSITGIRIIPFKHSPDWSNALEQTYKWNTDIIVNKDATEQRIRLREFPTTSIMYTILVGNEDSRSLQNLLMAWGDKPVALPMWMDEFTIYETATTAQKNIVLHEKIGTSAAYSEIFFSPVTNSLYTFVTQETDAIELIPSVVLETFEIPLQTQDYIQEFSYPDVLALRIEIQNSPQYSADTIRIESLDGLTLYETVVYNIDAYDIFLQESEFRLHVDTTNSTHDPIIVTVSKAQKVRTLVGDANLLDQLPVDTVLYPCSIAYMSNIGTFTTHNDSVKEVELTFTTDPLGGMDENTDVTLYQGFPVEERSQDWSEGQDQDLASNIYVNNYNTGILDVGNSVDFIGSALSKIDVAYDQFTIDALRRTLASRAGRLNGFWLPTDTTDIVLYSEILSSTALMVSAFTNLTLLFSNSKDFKHLRIQINDGTTYYREILGVVDNEDGTETLTLDVNLDATYQPEDIKKISFMTFVRSSFDTSLLVWDTDSFATIKQSYEGILS